jgi:hypothetical protein
LIKIRSITEHNNSTGKQFIQFMQGIRFIQGIQGIELIQGIQGIEFIIW